SIFEKIAYATSKGIETRFFSNLSLLTEEKAEKLVKSGISRIKVSVDGNSAETFEKIRSGLKFDVVMNNIELLLKTRKKLGSRSPEVGLIYVETPENEHETKDFINKWQGRVDSIDISSYHNWAGGLGTEGVASDKRRFPCLRVWQTFTVLWNGEVSLCCMDYDGKVTLGNVRDNTIKEIFSGEKMRRIREVHLTGDFKKIPLCSNCFARR
ncbi:MAG: SPASM domain-containing protein, partial [Deltaproteobacteria bacterium]|nr:SPASM domain-containing protein [Deltaproteobacteria bacterium]